MGIYTAWRLWVVAPVGPQVVTPSLTPASQVVTHKVQELPGTPAPTLTLPTCLTRGSLGCHSPGSSPNHLGEASQPGSRVSHCPPA
ncbi:hypothetical protein Hamer_G011060 [Homarus americanus]|uniref:Uncharacterized protein n=1 Tax=Homarus americanus TaxID=6706 RepID=A0A8J5MVQ7_HOMAM|nr:hypothetical protein Hamer_G011060 [Homarus americanus]